MTDREIKHLDWYPQGPEAISALQDMAAMDSGPEEAHPSDQRRGRIGRTAAALVASMAISAAGMGYYNNASARSVDSSTASEVGGTMAGVVYGLAGGFFAYCGLAGLYYRNRPMITETE